MPEQDWSRLADYVVHRRRELGYSRQLDLVHDSSIGLRTLGSIETGKRTQYNRSTLAALEQALDWEPGSVQAILDGGEPTSAAPREPGEPELLTEQEEAVWAIKSIPPDRRWSMILHLRQFPTQDVG